MAEDKKTLAKIDQVAAAEAGGKPSVLAEMIGEYPQKITNWRIRGIPKAGAKKIHALFGYTVQSLIDDNEPLSKGFLDSLPDDELTREIIGDISSLDESKKILVKAYLAALKGSD